MNLYLYPGVTLALWVVGLWLLLRDVDTRWPDKEEHGSKNRKTALIYGLVMLFVTEGAAVMFLTLYRDVDPWTAVKRLSLLCVMWPVALTDLKTYRIPNAFILFGLACRVLIFPFELFCSEPGVWQVLLTEVIAAGAMLLASVLCALIIRNSMGLLLGTRGIWGAVFLSLIVIFFISVFALITKRKSRKDLIPFGPALVIGTYLAVYLTGM